MYGDKRKRRTSHVPSVDELWLHDWAAVRIAALERYLAKQSAAAGPFAVRVTLIGTCPDSPFATSERG